jgi:tetratricopeptide (TPR) repeat protein
MRLIVQTFILLLTSLAGFSQKSLDCNAKAVQDSLFEKFSARAYQLDMNDKRREEVWDSLLAICPNIAEVYQEKSTKYIRNGDYAKAFDFVDKAVLLDSVAWTAYRGFLHCIYTKNYEKALIDLERAENLSPYGNQMDHNYWFYCGLSYLELGAYEKAETAFLQDIKQQRRRVETNDIHFNTLLYLGIVYLEMMEFDKAEKTLKDCLQYYEQLPEANYYLARTLKSIGNPGADLYIQKAKQYLLEGYKINEPTEMFVNYPRQISLKEMK